MQYFGYLAASSLEIALTLVFVQLFRKKLVHGLLVMAAFVSFFWHLTVVNLSPGQTLSLGTIQLLEVIRYGIWIIAIFASIEFSLKQSVPNTIKYSINGLWIALAFIVVVMLYLGVNFDEYVIASIYKNLLLAILGVVVAEQLSRNSNNSRFTKFLGIGLVALFGYDIFIFSYMLIFRELSMEYWQARGLVSGAIAVFIALTALLFANQSLQRASFTLSRSMVFFSTGLSFAGAFLVFMSIAGIYVRSFGGSWGAAIQILIYVLSLISITILLYSPRVRARVNVAINKHIFIHKYDYREEWKRLNSKLSDVKEGEDSYQRATKAVTSIFKSSGGGLWLKGDHHYSPCYMHDMSTHEGSLSEELYSPFCDVLEKEEWVFSPSLSNSECSAQFDHVLPPWIENVADVWVIIPLLTEKELLGFMVLTKEGKRESLNWEDLDLLRMVGRQAASYLGHQNVAEKLAEARQFDAFNKLTAFAVHDLKNLIAQQGFMIKNAEKHRHKPEFIDDVFRTIDNSVTKMDGLLQKLQNANLSSNAKLDLNQVVKEAAEQCNNSVPIPVVQLSEGKPLLINGEKGRVLMMMCHIIKNAQEATDPKNGFVNVDLYRQDNHAVIKVKDNGVGMDEEFQRNRLFKPFSSTKNGKGMGIGAYQIKHLVSSLKGNIKIDSAPGKGTCFQVTLPLLEAI